MGNHDFLPFDPTSITDIENCLFSFASMLEEVSEESHFLSMHSPRSAEIEGAIQDLIDSGFLDVQPDENDEPAIAIKSSGWRLLSSMENDPLFEPVEKELDATFDSLEYDESEEELDSGENESSEDLFKGAEKESGAALEPLEHEELEGETLARDENEISTDMLNDLEPIRAKAIAGVKKKAKDKSSKNPGNKK